MQTTEPETAKRRSYEFELRSSSRSRELRRSFGATSSGGGGGGGAVYVAISTSPRGHRNGWGNPDRIINNSAIIKRRRRSACLRDDFSLSSEGDDDEALESTEEEQEKDKDKEKDKKKDKKKEKLVFSARPRVRLVDSSPTRSQPRQVVTDKAQSQDTPTPSTAATTPSGSSYSVPQLPRFNFIPATPLPLMSPAAILDKQLGEHSISLVSTTIAEEAETAATKKDPAEDLDRDTLDDAKPKRPGIARSKTMRDSRLHPWWRPRRYYNCIDYEDANLAKLLEGTEFSLGEDESEYSSSKPTTPKAEWTEYGPLKIDKKRKLVGVGGVQIQWVGLGGLYDRFLGGKKDQQAGKSEKPEKSKEDEKEKEKEGEVVNGEKRRGVENGNSKKKRTEAQKEKGEDEEERQEEEKQIEIKRVNSRRKIWITQEVRKPS